jgi:hypothetical protein
MGNDLRDAEFAESIAADVLSVLKQKRFFELLDDRFCPASAQLPHAQCVHSYANTIEILHGLGVESEEIEDVLAVMRFNGGCCDCEILYNVAEESRLKAAYWKACAKELTTGSGPQTTER